MRWYHSRPYHPVEGELRTVKKFLWLPKRLQDETRWLETARWVEVCVFERRTSPDGFAHDGFIWKPLEWCKERHMV